MPDFKIFTGNSNNELATKVAQHLHKEAINSIKKPFANKEIR